MKTDAYFPILRKCKIGGFYVRRIDGNDPVGKCKIDKNTIKGTPQPLRVMRGEILLCQC